MCPQSKEVHLTKEQLAEELTQLENELGEVTPRRVVDAARSLDSPLHDLFLWDNNEAGDRYRIAQARALIRSVEVEYLHGETRVATIKYVHVPQSDKSQSYRNVITLRDDRTAARETTLLELAHARAAIQRARSVAFSLDYDGLFEALLTSLEKLRETVGTTDDDEADDEAG